MCNKLFLSHSSEDLRIVTAFVNFMYNLKIILQLSLLKKRTIFIIQLHYSIKYSKFQVLLVRFHYILRYFSTYFYILRHRLIFLYFQISLK